jgi:hypothetical protein
MFSTLVEEESIEDLFQTLQDFWENDPIMKAMNSGVVRWGDLEYLFPEAFASRSEPTPIPNTIDDDSWEPVIKSTKTEKVEKERVVPQVTPGIKTIITRNLPRDITLATIRSAFEKYGPIKDIYIPKNMDKSSQYYGTVKGFAMIKFLKPEHSAKAFTEEYGRLRFGKNNITVEFAKEDKQ